MQTISEFTRKGSLEWSRSNEFFRVHYQQINNRFFKIIRLCPSLIQTDYSHLPRVWVGRSPNWCNFGCRYTEPILPQRITADNYIFRLLTQSPNKPSTQYTTYFSEPIKKYIGKRKTLCFRKHVWHAGFMCTLLIIHIQNVFRIGRIKLKSPWLYLTDEYMACVTMVVVMLHYLSTLG